MTYVSMYDIFHAWQKESAKLKNGEITEDEYNTWRYNYPKFDTTLKWVKIPSKELSDTLVKQFKDNLKDDM